jgi:predicted glycosyltransferase
MDPHTGDPSRLRIALYSHDAEGLGHVRRNLAIAVALGRLDPPPDLLLVSGAAEAAGLPRPRGCDVVTLPGLTKDRAGGYASRYLTLPVSDLLDVRSAVAAAGLAAFKPDLLVVDRHPRGVFGELEPALTALRARRTRIVLGLRDVLDDPRAAREEWVATHADQALRRWYDAVWVYGDPAVYDLVADLGVQATGVSPTYTGYLGPTEAGSTAARSQLVVGLVGGGHDGMPVAEAFAAAPPPAGYDAVLVTGPRMTDGDHAEVLAVARRNPRVRIERLLPGCDELLDRAAAVVTMGGYNTLCEVLGRGLPTLVVPRVHPRAEQLVRALALERRGLVDVLHPEALSPDAVAAWTAAAVSRDRSAATGVDLGGLGRLPDLVRRLLPRSRERGEEVCRVAS